VHTLKVNPWGCFLLATLVDIERLISPKELAARTGKYVGTITHWREIGYGPKPIRIGWAWFYPLDEVERWEQEQAAK
jgi:predicted DNA-binding transcriptional regulator AlpA